jgi:hypothetical protein
MPMNDPTAFRLNRFCQLRAYVLLLAGCVPCSISQGALVYTFSGQVPSHTNPLALPLEDTHPFIEPGETWVATFVINENARPDYFRVPLAQYPRAIMRGSLRFSGGYVARHIIAAGYDVWVMNDGEGVYDSVTVNVGGLYIRAITDLNPLKSLALPGRGTRLLPNPSNLPNWPQFRFIETIGAIVYKADLSNNVSFAAVPEPTSLALALLLGASLVMAHRGWPMFSNMGGAAARSFHCGLKVARPRAVSLSFLSFRAPVREPEPSALAGGA